MNGTKTMTRAGLFLLAAIFPAGPVQAQDFSNCEYRNVGASRGGRVTAVAGTVAATATFYVGAWHENEEERFRDGPLAKPGTCTARLSAVADPNAQVDLSLQLVDLLSEAR